MSYDIHEGVNMFAKTTLKVIDQIPNVDDYKIAIKRGAGTIDIVAVPKEEVDNAKPDLVLDFPPYDGDKVNFAIELAGLVAAKVATMGMARGAAANNAKLTPEERRARAKKAAAARWAKKSGEGIDK